MALRGADCSMGVGRQLSFSYTMFSRRNRLITGTPRVPIRLNSVNRDIQDLVRTGNRDLGPKSICLRGGPCGNNARLPSVAIVAPIFLSFLPPSSPLPASRPPLFALRSSLPAPRSPLPRFCITSHNRRTSVNKVAPNSVPPSDASVRRRKILLSGIRLMSRNHFLRGRLQRVLAATSCPIQGMTRGVTSLRTRVTTGRGKIRRLRGLIGHCNLTAIRACVRRIRSGTRRYIHQIVSQLRSNRFSCPVSSNDRVIIQIAISHTRHYTRVSFTKASRRQPGGFGTPLTIAGTTILCIFEALIRSSVPLGTNYLGPLSVRIPTKSVLGPAPPTTIITNGIRISRTIASTLCNTLKTVTTSRNAVGGLAFNGTRCRCCRALYNNSKTKPKFPNASTIRARVAGSHLASPRILR